MVTRVCKAHSDGGDWRLTSSPVNINNKIQNLCSTKQSQKAAEGKTRWELHKERCWTVHYIGENAGYIEDTDLTTTSLALTRSSKESPWIGNDRIWANLRNKEIKCHWHKISLFRTFFLDGCGKLQPSRCFSPFLHNVCIHTIQQKCLPQSATLSTFDSNHTAPW